MRRVIWWVRDDLRLAQNPVLTEALPMAPEIVPIFIRHSRYRTNRERTHQQRFLDAGLDRLNGQLQERGSRLILREGSPAKVLAELMHETGSDKVVAQTDYSPVGRREGKSVSELPVHWVHGQSIRHPGEVLKNDGRPYTTFTPFMKAWRKLPPPQRNESALPGSIATPADLPTLPLESQHRSESLLEAGEEAAQQRLTSFVSGRNPVIYRYSSTRDELQLHEGTSLLSPYLHFGMLSPLQAAWTARRAMDTAPNQESFKGAETWLSELIWRDFFISIAYHFPFVSDQSFRSGMRDLQWLNRPEDFQAWCEGRTGYPVVDAGMRQLRQTGWMHNRARMITASFLVKNLLVDWRMGEEWFLKHLVDADDAVNNGNWQWVAGTGTDAAPWFRIFNPILQGQKFDPEGVYTRRWVPELKEVPTKLLQTPWSMTPELQRDSHCKIGESYPAPIVDYKESRSRALEIWTQLREGN